ncbi:hypothetical protein GC105_10575 [Alkalibaculum sp. M08DMB]|uniref:Uncharacterized protein n=1 Tax=Alkalibaculum sporogenes TaxID=2655001 RepID=A0A6A7KA43_9FIRM|nr:hypothetical protein [Alkalibaculum sporogenes]MPW26232.1 hypothetical protein [Alkalibaculum sporogenes]
MADIYTNTPNNQKKFEEFWDEPQPLEPPLSCDQMVRRILKELDTFNPDDTFSLVLVKEMLMECLRGC